MSDKQSARAGYFQGECQEMALRHAYRPETDNAPVTDYLQADPERVRQVMEVYTDALLIVQGTKPPPSAADIVGENK